MSKIDLSQAKIGDKFRTRDGRVMKYVGYDRLLDLYIVSSENHEPYPVQKDGRFLCERECFSDLAGQVLDKPLDELIEEGTKRIKENDDAIAEENELQRRQEVVELAEKMYTMLEIENIKYYLCNNGKYAFKSKDLVKVAFMRAASFVNNKHKYLNEGKL